MAATWSKNPFFRLLVFLDIVGLQPFSVARDLGSDGIFVDVERTFGAGTVAREILSHGIHCFRANIARLFVDEEERDRVLFLVSDSNKSTKSFSEAVLAPFSLAALNDAIENDLPLWCTMRISEAFGLTGGATSLEEQFLIDAIDEWMNHRSQKENDAMVLACGVQPEVLQSARARASELPHAVEDFIIDVVFPPPFDNVDNKSKSDTNKVGEQHGVIDWLITAYEKCYEVVYVDDGEEIEEKVDEDECTSEPVRKRERVEADKREGEEEFITAENLDWFMHKRPFVIPKEILRQKRRPLHDRVITEFELQNHYTATELYAFVREVVGGAKRRPKKADCIKIILAYHGVKNVESSVTEAVGGTRENSA